MIKQKERERERERENGQSGARDANSQLRNSCTGFFYRFNNLRFKSPQTSSCCLFETCSYFFVPREIMKARLLKRLVDHPTPCETRSYTTGGF